MAKIKRTKTKRTKARAKRATRKTPTAAQRRAWAAGAKRLASMRRKATATRPSTPAARSATTMATKKRGKKRRSRSFVSTSKRASNTPPTARRSRRRGGLSGLAAFSPKGIVPLAKASIPLAVGVGVGGVVAGIVGPMVQDKVGIKSSPMTDTAIRVGTGLLTAVAAASVRPTRKYAVGILAGAIGAELIAAGFRAIDAWRSERAQQQITDQTTSVQQVQLTGINGVDDNRRSLYSMASRVAAYN